MFVGGGDGMNVRVWKEEVKEKVCGRWGMVSGRWFWSDDLAEEKKRDD